MWLFLFSSQWNSITVSVEITSRPSSLILNLKSKNQSTFALWYIYIIIQKGAFLYSQHSDTEEITYISNISISQWNQGSWICCSKIEPLDNATCPSSKIWIAVFFVCISTWWCSRTEEQREIYEKCELKIIADDCRIKKPGRITSKR